MLRFTAKWKAPLSENCYFFPLVDLFKDDCAVIIALSCLLQAQIYYILVNPWTPRIADFLFTQYQTARFAFYLH